jgi:dTDP-4-amino-4,6-dideoxygalactose transaminase
MSDAPAPVPFNRPCIAGRELYYIAQAVVKDQHISGDGRFTRLCSAFLEEALGAPRVLLTTSCTHALEMAALLLDLGPEDEVILPSFTFVSTANAFALFGARPVFVDIRPDTLNMDESLLEGLLTDRTAAVVPVHYAGVGCEMDAIGEISRRRGIPVVEDNAQGILARYRGRCLGTFGSLGALSFHETKNFHCGEGGALVLNDPALVERAEIIREKGTDRSRFFRGEVDRYTWVDRGSSYLPSDVLAAFLYAQFEARDAITAARRRVWEAYGEGLADWAKTADVRLPFVPPHCEPSFHMYYLVCPTSRARDGLIEHLARRSIHSVFHFLPLHLSRMGQSFGGRSGDCPVTEDISQRLVRLPFYNDLVPGDQERVIEAVKAFVP